MTGAELRVLASLLLQLGMEGAKVVQLLRQHGVTDEQIAEADLENEISVREAIERKRRN